MKRDFSTQSGNSFTVSYANCVENGYNCHFPNEVIVNNADEFSKVCLYDHILGSYKDNYRSSSNFISANALGMDCDNDHSDYPKDWKTYKDVQKAFPGVPFYVTYSRNHNKVKKNKSARPRFHVIFLIDTITDSNSYSNLKKQALNYFPYFDSNAIDVARLFFGTKNNNVEFVEGNITLNKFLEKNEQLNTSIESEILEGERNSTLHKYALKVIKRYGDSEKALISYLDKSNQCNPPLDEKEIKSIFNSARKYYHSTIVVQEDYVLPDDYDLEYEYIPEDYSDVGQAKVLVNVFGNELKFTKGAGYLRYNGILWEDSKQRAQAAVQELTDLQLEEARIKLKIATKQLIDTGTKLLIDLSGLKKAQVKFNKTQQKAYNNYITATAYNAFVIKRRESKYISATLKEAEPMLEMGISDFDKDPFLLNTPDYTIDLRKGIHGIREHRADDFITKCTLCSLNNDGIKEWKSSLKLFFQNNEDLENYVQDIIGLSAIGRVYAEFMVVAHGGGRNGKSTFFNTLSSILGTYSGKISADSLTVGCRRNVKPELAETKGKRLIIASELEEGTRLNTSIIKQFCSTDEIFAEKKYKDPFAFIPSHTLVLYTNHLPKVGATDPGTWRRLVVIPFNATIEGNSDILNYSQHLVEHCGGAILAWIVEGAKNIIDKKYKLTKPKCVIKAINSYRDDNDWLNHYLSDTCEIEGSLTEKSGDLYTYYRTYCSIRGEYIRSTADFYAALDLAGFKRRRTKKGSFVYGIKLKENNAEDDFLK